MKRTLAAAAAALLCLGLVGCGNDTEGSDSASQSTTGEPGEAGGEETGAATDAPLETFTHELGFTVSFPRGWTTKVSDVADSHSWMTPGDVEGKEQGWVSLMVFNTAQTAEEWFRMIYANDDAAMKALRSKRSTRVPEIGKGLRARMVHPEYTHELMVASALDGVVVVVTVMDPGPELEPHVEDIFASLTRVI